MAFIFGFCMDENKKYFWLKLDRNFFKRHDIRIIEERENGKDYILFYLKLLVESIDHEGCLRFNDLIPYDAKMLAVITNTNIDIAKQAVKIFTELGMMEVFDDGTIYMKEIEKMIGSECDSAKRVREYRERKALQCNGDVTKSNTEKELDIDKDITKEKYKKEKSPPKASLPVSEIKVCFDKFYSSYPKKKSPKLAEKTFAKVVSEQKIKTIEELNAFTEKLINAVKLQISEHQIKNPGQDYKYWKHPSSWLNAGAWNDDVDLRINQQPPNQRRPKTAAQQNAESTAINDFSCPPTIAEFKKLAVEVKPNNYPALEYLKDYKRGNFKIAHEYLGKIKYVLKKHKKEEEI